MMVEIAKKYAVWIALVLTLLATWHVSQQEENEDVVGLPKARPILTTQPVALTQHEQLVNADTVLPRGHNDNPQNIFTVLAPVTDKPNEMQNTAPVVPTQPYVYAGKIIDGAQMTVFLLNGENGYAVKVGDVLDEVWKVKAIKPPNLTLRYLPLKTDVQLDIGVVN